MKQGRKQAKLSARFVTRKKHRDVTEFTQPVKRNIWQQRKNSGVPINESVQKEMTEVRDELGLTQYKFPWE